MSKEVPQLLKGFRDYLPQEQAIRRKVTNKIAEVFERFGFSPLDTPALEPYDLFAGKIGEDEKLIYKFKDLGERDVALRYDLTVPLMRILAEYNDLPKPFKRYQIGNVWRADKPQKGRYREFLQCDIDIVGSDSKLADAEVIAALIAAYNSFEVGTFEVKMNDRQLVDQALTELGIAKDKVPGFIRVMDKVDKIGEEKAITTLVEQGFESDILKKYSEIMDRLSQPYFEEMEGFLKSLGVANMRFDKYLMRGQDYYTGIIFEFVLKEKPDFGSVGGGGRYDKMIGSITGNEMPAVGGSIGFDRLLAALTDLGSISPQTAAEVIIFNLDEKLTADYLNIATNLRQAGLDAELYYNPVKLDKQFKYAEAKNSQVAVIFGTEEAKERKVNLKDLRSKEQRVVDLDNIIPEIKSMLW